jgi:hypothetical protein
VLAEEKQSRLTTDVLFGIVFRTPAGVCAKCKSAAKTSCYFPSPHFLAVRLLRITSSFQTVTPLQIDPDRSLQIASQKSLSLSLSLSSRKEQIPKLNNYDLITAHRYGLQFTPRNPSNTTGPNYTFFNRSKFCFQERLRVKDFPTSYKIQILKDSITMTSIRADRTLLFFNFQFQNKKSIEITKIVSFS